MSMRFLATAVGLAASSVALAQGTVSFDMVPEGYYDVWLPPDYIRIVDVFVDIAPTDVWTAAGLRVVTENGATISYFDQDPNTDGIQPGLFNPGVLNKFKTSLSKPRLRDGIARFTNSAAVAGGSYDPASPIVITESNLLNVAYFASPSETSGSPSTDGYIARVSVDFSGVTPVPGFDIYDHNTWGASTVANIPLGAIVVARSVPVSQESGTEIATFDVPTLPGVSWALWYIPEPSAVLLLALGGLMATHRGWVDGAR